MSIANLVTKPKPILATQTMLDVSTGMLSATDIAILNAAAQAERKHLRPPMRVVEHRYGYTVFVAPDVLAARDEVAPWVDAGMSPVLVAILIDAALSHCMIVNFDADADEVDTEALLANHGPALRLLGLEI